MNLPRPGHKALLVCPTCGRDAPPDDWHRRPSESQYGRRVAYVCPRCDSVLTYRPAADAGVESDARVAAAVDR